MNQDARPGLLSKRQKGMVSLSEEPFGDFLLFIIPKENEKEVLLFEFPFSGSIRPIFLKQSTGNGWEALRISSSVKLLYLPFLHLLHFSSALLLPLSRQAPARGESDALQLPAGMPVTGAM